MGVRWLSPRTPEKFSKKLKNQDNLEFFDNLNENYCHFQNFSKCSRIFRENLENFRNNRFYGFERGAPNPKVANLLKTWWTNQ